MEMGRRAGPGIRALVGAGGIFGETVPWARTVARGGIPPVSLDSSAFQLARKANVAWARLLRRSANAPRLCMAKRTLIHLRPVQI